MPKSLTEAKSVEEAQKIFEERVLAALQPPPMMDVARIEQFMRERGGQTPQVAPQERTPRLNLPSTFNQR